jgi:hypothetical protein
MKDCEGHEEDDLKPTLEEYEQVAGLILGDHLSSGDYQVDNAVRRVTKGAWVRCWIYVRDKEVEDEKENLDTD